MAVMFLPTAILVALLFLLAGSAALLVWGLHGRHIGQEPHCRKCGYDLTGLTAERCPECGRIAQGRNVVTGVRRRRWGAVWSGAAVLLISSAGVGVSAYMRAKQLNWYKTVPDWVLAAQAHWDDTNAVKELTLRYYRGKASATTLLGLVPRALEKQKHWPGRLEVRGWYGNVWRDLLAQLDQGGHLSEGQLEQFHERLVRLDLDVRGKIWFGDEVLVGLITRVKGGGTGRFRIAEGSIRVGELLEEFRKIEDWEPTDLRGRPCVLSLEPRPEWACWSFLGLNSGAGLLRSPRGGLPAVLSSQPRPDWSCWTFDSAKLGVGTHIVEVRATIQFDQPSFQRDYVIRKEIDIVPADSPVSCRWIADPSMVADFRKCFEFSVEYLDVRGSEHCSNSTCATVRQSDYPPMPAVFELLFRVGQREVRIGRLAILGGERYGWALFTKLIDYGDETQVVPVLRTTVEAAKAFPEIEESWEGEIVFDPVEVVRR